MTVRWSEMRDKDVIRVEDGRRLGFLTDLALDPDCGKITAVCVSRSTWGGEKNSVCVPWCDVVCVGEDAILVRCVALPKPESKPGLLQWLGL